MGRPREHGAATRLALLESAEALVERGGPDALSVRAAAEEVGTTTRAVYSLFGSKAGLLDALSQRAYEMLEQAISELPISDDPASDLVEASVQVFRPMAVGHPSLFRLSFLRIVPALEPSDATKEAARRAFSLLRQRFERLAEHGLLAGRHPQPCASAFNALCEGLATTELRRNGLLGDDPESAWRDAIGSLIAGFATPPPPPPPASKS